MKKIIQTVTMAGLLCMGVQAGIIYQEDFEALGTAGDPLPYNGPNDGWKWAVEGWNAARTAYAWGYYPEEAANAGIYGIESGQAGPDQGTYTLRSYADYGADHNSAEQINTMLRYEYTVSAADAALGTITFDLDYKNIGLVAASNSSAFVTMQVVDSVGGSFATLESDSLEILESDANWTSAQLSIDVSGHTGQLLQFGTQTWDTQWGPTGVGVDNINVQAVPEPATIAFVGIFGGAMLFLRRLRIHS